MVWLENKTAHSLKIRVINDDAPQSVKNASCRLAMDHVDSSDPTATVSHMVATCEVGSGAARKSLKFTSSECRGTHPHEVHRGVIGEKFSVGGEDFELEADCNPEQVDLQGRALPPGVVAPLPGLSTDSTTTE